MKKRVKFAEENLIKKVKITFVKDVQENSMLLKF